MLEEDTFQVGNRENEHSNHEGGRCGICMDVIIDRGVLDCCQHWFCFACIDNWSTITNLCPLCQGEFQLITCVPVYDTIGSNNVDEDSLSRDNDWFIEGKSNTLSFPSYYIDENAVICLDGDGCKIRNRSTLEGFPNFDTSIACDSCDLWYHAFCVGFDPEGTSEDTWLCPRCTVEVPQKSDANLIKSENNESGPESVSGEYLAEAAFSGKVSVSVADAGETAVVVSMVGGNQRSEEPNDHFLSTLEVDEDLGTETFLPDATGPKDDSQLNERTNIQPVLGTQELELSLLHDTSLSLPSNSSGHSELKIGGADAKVNDQSCFDGVKISLTNSFGELYEKKLSESESSIGLHLGLSVGSFLSVDDMNKNVFGEQNTINKNVTEDITMNKNVTVTEDQITTNKIVIEDPITMNNNLTEDQISMNKNVTEGQITMNKNVTEDQITMNKYVTENQTTRDEQQQNPSGESLPKVDKIESGAGEDVSQIIGVKRKHTDCSDDASLSGDNEEIKAKKVTEVSAKRRRAEGRIQMIPPKKEANTSSSVDSQKCPTSMADPQDYKSKCHLDKEDIACIMDIVKGPSCRPAKELAHHNSADKPLKERENASGLRVKKIMKRAAEDNDSSELVQELRKEIREFVRNRSSKDFGENLFDPKLLAAFRAAIAGPKPEPVKKVSPLAVKVKKSMLEKGKVRENLTKKIYGNPNGRRRRAWDRDCEVEFWKYRCMRASKPEKIETLKSVLNLLRKNSESSDAEQVTGCQATNPILSRLYLADTSVFPRKDDIKPLSALKAPGNSDQSKEQAVSIEKASKLSPDDCASKVNEKGKFPSKVIIPLLDEKGTRTSVSCSKSAAASSKVNLSGRPKGPSVSSLGDSSVNSKSGMTVKSDNIKMDKRKWALEILARKTAIGGKSGTHERQEDNAVLKGNYPLLAQLPMDMRPVLAPSRHNKIPISVRQTQLYRLTDQFLRKANLPVICRTAETELAVADAINIEREVADRSNSKVVYLNLCSQEIMHRSDDKKSVKATESNSSSSSAVHVEDAIDKSEQAIDKLSDDPRIEEALRNAGLLSDSPPDSPYHPTEVRNKVGFFSMEMKEEEPDNVFEIESQPEIDIYGDFDYDLEDEDYIGATAVKASKVPPEEVASKMKVVFSTLSSEKSSNFVDLKDDGGWDAEKDSTCLLKSHTDAGIRSSTAEEVTCNTFVPPVSLTCEEGEDLSLAECEELYGPDKEPLVDKFPGESQKLYGLHDGEASAGSKFTGEASNTGTEENVTVNTNRQNSSSIEKSPSHSQKGDKILGKETTSSTDADKQCDSVNLVHKKVEAYVKEHIRPLCKSGVITAEEYRWAVAKTTDKVMKYHSNAKNANFLIKEGEKVKKLAEQYVEAAQQK